MIYPILWFPSSPTGRVTGDFCLRIVFNWKRRHKKKNKIKGDKFPLGPTINVHSSYWHFYRYERRKRKGCDISRCIYIPASRTEVNVDNILIHATIFPDKMKFSVSNRYRQTEIEWVESKYWINEFRSKSRSIKRERERETVDFDKTFHRFFNSTNSTLPKFLSQYFYCNNIFNLKF